jgi:hypothetical protein
MTRTSAAVFCAGCALAALAIPARAQSLQVVGQAGILGEWELSASLTQNLVAGNKEYSGPVTLKHVGMCAADGPEEKSGQMRLQLVRAASRLKATLTIEGVACSYDAKKADSYTGTMSCPDRPDVPLLMWLK